MLRLKDFVQTMTTRIKEHLYNGVPDIISYDPVNQWQRKQPMKHANWLSIKIWHTFNANI